MADLLIFQTFPTKCLKKVNFPNFRNIQYTEYRIMQIVRGGKLLRFSRISLQSWRFSSKFFLSIVRCFKLLYNRESFPTNNKKIMQLRNFSTANDLHYTVLIFCKEIFWARKIFTKFAKFFCLQNFSAFCYHIVLIYVAQCGNYYIATCNWTFEFYSLKC